MASVLDSHAPLPSWVQRYAETPPRVSVSIAAAIIILVLSTAFYLWSAKGDRVPALPDRIPYIFNTYQYMTDMRTFLARASEMLQARNILTFRLGPEKVYLVTKAHNIQHMFRTTANLNQERFALMLQKYVWGSTPDDYARFANDGSGKGRLPTPGYEGTPNDRRYWAPLHHILHDFLSGSRETGVLAGVYQRELTALLDGDGSQDFPVGEWRSAHVYAFLQRHMAEAATATLVGQRLMELNGGAAEFLKTFWEFDRIAASLVWGLPRWMNRGAWRARDTFHAAVKKYLFPPAEQFDFDAPGTSEADWEPVFGSRANREMVRWMRRAGFDEQTITGAVATLFVFGTNGNTIPITGWCVMEIVKSLSLLRRVRDEVATAMVNVDPATGRGEIDAQRLVALPLLQSIYTEAMRLHVSMNVTREIAGPMKMEGFTLERGALLQAATEITHQDEAIWGAPGHPATEFWADRHIKCVEKIDSSGGIVRQPQFVMAGKATEFFPYGGGIPICPGRFFAKQEIMLTVALLVLRFDMEFVEWTTLDGLSTSKRPAENDVRWSGGAAVPPDRDMKIRWKRRW